MVSPFPGRQSASYSHVICQVMFLQRVSVKAVGCRVEVITADSADETFGLLDQKRQ